MSLCLDSVTYVWRNPVFLILPLSLICTLCEKAFNKLQLPLEWVLIGRRSSCGNITLSFSQSRTIMWRLFQLWWTECVPGGQMTEGRSEDTLAMGTGPTYADMRQTSSYCNSFIQHFMYYRLCNSIKFDQNLKSDLFFIQIKAGRGLNSNLIMQTECRKTLRGLNKSFLQLILLIFPHIIWYQDNQVTPEIWNKLTQSLSLWSAYF